MEKNSTLNNYRQCKITVIFPFDEEKETKEKHFSYIDLHRVYAIKLIIFYQHTMCT